MQGSPELEGDRPSILELASARDVETLVRARANAFLVTNRDGNVAPAGARELGLFDSDTRHLSFYEMRLCRGDVAYLSAEASSEPFNQIDLMVSGLERESVLGDPQNFLHIRRRQLLDDGFIEQVSFTNYLRRSTTIEVQLGFDADFADMFEVRGLRRARRGVLRAPVVDKRRVLHTYRGLDGTEYRTELSFDPEPRRLSAHLAVFELELPAGETRGFEVHVVPSRDDATRDGPKHEGRSFALRCSVAREEAQAFRQDATRFRCDDPILQQTLDRSAADLFSLRLPSGALAAGIPWFAAPFGRDSLLACYEALPFHPGLAADALRFLARYQGTKDDPFTEEEPGKILHELRAGEVTRTREMPHTPYFGSVDATPLFVVLADSYYRVTADRDTLVELLPALRAALGWIDRSSQQGRAFVTYQKRTERGLDNQGWKDSWDSVVDVDGALAEAPIALCEVQGYCIDAYSRAARLLAKLGLSAEASEARARSERLRALFEQEFWLERSQRYAYAIDKNGRKLRTVVSNLGHLLWSRAVTPEHARLTAQALMSRDSFGGYGVRTLARGQVPFNPLSYHNGTIWPHDNALIAKGFSNYRLHEEAVRLFGALHAACGAFRDRRIPELFCGLDRTDGLLVRYPVACSPQAWSAAAPYLFLQATLGIHFDALDGELRIRDPRLPESVSELAIEGMRVAGSRVSMRFLRGRHQCHVDQLQVDGAPLRVLIDISTGGGGR